MLQVAFDSFARQSTTVFTSSLRTVCSVTLISVEQRTYAEYVDSLDASTYITMFSAEPMHTLGVLEMPLVATMTCIDHMLGGPGRIEQPERPLTEIESRRHHAASSSGCSREMRYSMSGVVPLDPMVTGVEYSPQFAQVAGAVRRDGGGHLRAAHQRAPLPDDHLPAVRGLLPHLVRAAAPGAGVGPGARPSARSRPPSCSAPVRAGPGRRGRPVPAHPARPRRPGRPRRPATSSGSATRRPPRSRSSSTAPPSPTPPPGRAVPGSPPSIVGTPKETP